MAAGNQQLLMIVLRSDIDEIFGQLPDQTGGDQAVIDVKAAAAVRLENPPDDTFICPLDLLLRQ